MRDNKKTNNYKYKQPRKGGDNKAIVVSDKKTVGPGESIQAQPLEVKVYGNNFDKALRAFRALVQKERILSTFKEKQSYEKPSDKRRRKRNESKRKLLEIQNNHGFKKNRREASQE
jgi:small subunit ribosomal protein S21